MKKLWMVLAILGSAGLTSCGNFRVEKADPSSARFPQLETGQIPGFNRLKATVFARNNCLDCHSRQGGNKGDVNLETYASIADPTNDLPARIKNEISVEQVMPPSGPASADDQALVTLWADNGGPENDLLAPVTPPNTQPSPEPSVDPSSVPSSVPSLSPSPIPSLEPSPVPSVQPSPVVVLVRYNDVKTQVFDASCIKCHGATVAKKGVRLDTYANVLKNLSGVQSEALDGLTMPPSQPLTAANQQLLRDWINDGALQ